MIAFTPDAVQPVLDRRKTVTLRGWRDQRVKEGEVHDAVQLGFPEKVFAKVRIARVDRIRVEEIGSAVAQKDGAMNPAAARAFWTEVAGIEPGDPLWLVEFELVDR